MFGNRLFCLRFLARVVIPMCSHSMNNSPQSSGGLCAAHGLCVLGLRAPAVNSDARNPPRRSPAGVIGTPPPSSWPIGMGYARVNLWLCGGITSTSRPASYMCGAPTAGLPAFIGGRELRALRRLQRDGQPGRYVFVSERM